MTVPGILRYRTIFCELALFNAHHSTVVEAQKTNPGEGWRGKTPHVPPPNRIDLRAIQRGHVQPILLLVGVCLVEVLNRYGWLVHSHLPMLPTLAT